MTLSRADFHYSQKHPSQEVLNQEGDTEKAPKTLLTSVIEDHLRQTFNDIRLFVYKN